MDDLIKLCDELEKCKKSKSCYSNEIGCAKSKVKCYIDGDFDKLLKLKAQIKIHSDIYDEQETISLMVAILTFSLTVLKSVSGEKSDGYVLYGIMGLMIILILCILFSHFQKKYGYRDKWKRYIEVVLEDIEKEHKGSIINH